MAKLSDYVCMAGYAVEEEEGEEEEEEVDELSLLQADKEKGGKDGGEVAHNNSELLREPLLETGRLLGRQWLIDSEQLSKGGFGQIYRARRLDGIGVPVAVKVELCVEGRLCTVSHEAEALYEITNYHWRCRPTASRERDNHLLAIHDYGLDGCVGFLVMDLCGETVRDRKKAALDDRLGFDASLALAASMIDALRQVHAAGYLHRDVKPANFCFGIGLPTASAPHLTNENTLYVIDFGLAKKYVHSDGRHRSRRPSSGFRGTVRYASINTHCHRDMGRLDDLWPIFYIAVENIVGQLPWRCMTNKAQVLQMKETTDFSQLTASKRNGGGDGRRHQRRNNEPSSSSLIGIPESLLEMHRYLTKMDFYTTPNYDVLIYRLQEDRQLLAANVH